MIIVSYYTKNTPYEEVMNELLLPSLQRWKLDYDVQGINDLGSWQSNTSYKATFCRDMLLKHKQPIFFLDCDATIEKMPSLLYCLPNTIDIAFHHFSWFGHWRNQWDNTSNMQLLSGSLYISYNAKTISMCDEWIEKIGTELEQKTLDDIVHSNPNLSIYHLPAEYCCVLKQDYTIPDYIKDPKIVHWQRSRFYKRWHADKKDADYKIEKAKNFHYKP
jgi:hypothetical protein